MSSVTLLADDPDLGVGSSLPLLSPHFLFPPEDPLSALRRPDRGEDLLCVSADAPKYKLRTAVVPVIRLCHPMESMN